MDKNDRRQVIGVVLAGGASRRMGRDKARLRLDDSSLVERAVTRLRRVTDKVLIADRGRRVLPDERSVPDGPGGGPAAGLLGAAAVYPDHDLLALACDLPAVTTELLEYLARPGDLERPSAPVSEAAPDLGNNYDAHVPRWQHGIEPLCALYRPTALAALAAAVAAGRLALHRLLLAGDLQVRCLEGDALAAFGAPHRLFLNLNTPQDLARWKATE